MKAVSRTIMARGLAVLATTAGVFLAGSSMAQTSAPAPATASAPAAGPAADGKGGPGMHHHGMHHGRRGGEHAGMARMDTDGDGVISRAEFDAAGQKMADMRNKMFEAADTNKDGKLTKDEMRAFHKANRGGMRGDHDHGAMKGRQPGQPGAPAAPAPKQ